MTAELGCHASVFSSVVIPSHNRGPLLAGCLASLLALDHPGEGYEIVVVAAGCTDDTAAVVKAFVGMKPGLRVQLLPVPYRDANTARNAGFAAARGQLLVLVDDDVIVPPQWLNALAAGARDWPEADCLGGGVRPLFEATAPRTCPGHELPGARLDEGPVSREVDELWGGNMAIRRDALARIGEFRPGLRFGQEWEWEQRLRAGGGRLRYLPEAWLWHRRTRSDVRLGPMMREYFLRGYAKARFDSRTSSRTAVRQVVGNLRHAARTGCSRGLAEAARQCGLLCGGWRHG